MKKEINWIECGVDFKAKVGELHVMLCWHILGRWDASILKFTSGRWHQMWTNEYGSLSVAKYRALRKVELLNRTVTTKI